MPKFSYTAKDMQGNKLKGVIDAPNADELYSRMRAEGIYVLSAKEARRTQYGKRLNQKQLGEFCRQLGTMLQAGVSLARALNILASAETITDYERGVFTELLRLVRQGTPLSDTMESLGGVFPDLLVNMLRTAEAGGNMDKVAMRMAVFYEKQYRLNKKVSGAMVYPAILAIMLVLATIFIMTFILPQFESLFTQMDELPGITTALMNISNAFINDWALILVGVALVIVCFAALLRVRPIKMFFSKVRVHFPVVGKLSKIIYTARFARTLSSLYTAGLPIVTSLTISGRTIGNIYIQDQFTKVVTAVRGGEPMSQALLQVDGFVRKLADSVMIGEETGNLDGMLESTADAMEYDSEQALSKLVAMLEPAMIIIMAVVIAFVMLAVLMPVFQYYSSMQTMSYM